MRYRRRMRDGVLPLETYARALACLLSQREQPIEEVLGGLGVTLEQLQAADATYNDQLGVAFRRRKGILGMKFAQAFAEARRERGLFGAPPAPPPAPAAPAPEAPALPSYLNAPHAPVSVAPAMAAPVSVAPGSSTLPASPDAARGPSTPWDQSQVQERVGKLTLAHFAALTIELGRNPPDVTPILRRYGLGSADDLRHVHAAFQAQMSVDPAMKGQFEALLARMRSMAKG